jgi:hypothetical protein
LSGFDISAYQRLIAASSRRGSRRAGVQRAARVAADDVAHARLEQDLRHRDAGGAEADDEHVQVLDALAGDLDRVEQRGEDDDRRAVLVVVEDGDVELGLQPVLDLEAPRRRDVLEVDAAERGRQALDGLDDLVGVLRVRQIGKASTPANSLKSIALPSMTGIAGLGADVAQARAPAVPSLTTATVLRLIVNWKAFSRSARSPGRRARRRACRPSRGRRGSCSGILLCCSILPPRCTRNVRSVVSSTRAGPASPTARGSAPSAPGRRVDGDVAQRPPLVGVDEVDGADLAAGAPDRGQDRPERAGAVVELDADRERVLSLGRGRP